MGHREDSILAGIRTLAIGALATVALALAIWTPSASAACANEAIRASQASEALPGGSTYLPGCMAFEMLTPPKKFGQETFSFTAFSSDGGRALFVSKAALAETPGLQSFGGDAYVATRSSGGWGISPTSPPAGAEISAGGEAQGGPYAFSPDLGSWALFGATQKQKFAGKAALYSGALGGAFAPLSPLLEPIDNSGENELFLLVSQLSSAGTSADVSHSIFAAARASSAYLLEDPRDNATANRYVAFRNPSGQPTIQLLARDGANKVWGGRCGAFLGGEGGGLNQGAVSTDGSRIFFSTRPAQTYDPTHPSEAPASPACDSANPLRILVRTGEAPTIEELLPGDPEAPGDDIYQGASVDGTKVFLATPRKLTTSDQDASAQPCGATLGASKGCDLYLYDATEPPGSRLTQVSHDPTPGKEASVLSSITAVSADGSHAYFVAQGVLTGEANPQGQTAAEGSPNLYLYERDAANPTGHIAFLGRLDSGDAGKLWGGNKSLVTGAYPVPLLGGGDGHTLFFLSKAALTPEDTDSARADIYRYDSSGTATLQCVSCAPGGDSFNADVFAGSVENSPSSNFAEQGRWASDDGETVAFVTKAPLGAGDEDEAPNIYLWKEGRLAELPSQITGEVRPYKLPTVSPSGNQVGFTTTIPILPQDGDTARDAYVVRAEGGFPNPVTPTICNPLTEGGCQGAGTTPAPLPAPTTNNFSGPGNPKAPAKCKKGFTRKHGKCVKKRAKKQHKKKKGGKHKKKRAGHKQGGGK